MSESPLLTWGEIEGTPFLLDGSDTPLPRHPGGPQFRIPEPRSRERLALSLADGVARRSAARRSAALDQMRSSFLRWEASWRQVHMQFRFSPVVFKHQSFGGPFHQHK